MSQTICFYLSALNLYIGLEFKHLKSFSNGNKNLQMFNFEGTKPNCNPLANTFFIFSLRLIELKLKITEFGFKLSMFEDKPREKSFFS